MIATASAAIGDPRPAPYESYGSYAPPPLMVVPPPNSTVPQRS